MERAKQVKTKKNGRKRISGITKRWMRNSLSVVVLVLLIGFALAGFFMTRYYLTSVESSIESRVVNTAGYLTNYMASDYNAFYNYSERLVADFADKDKLEMQILDVYGRVMFSSTGITAGFIPTTSDVADSFSTRDIATYTGYDAITGENVMSTTQPVISSRGSIIGAVRYVTSLRLLIKQVRNLYMFLLGGLGLAIALIIFTNMFFVRSIVNPVLMINELAGRIGKGQYGARLDIEFNDEIGELGTTINNMSAEIARMEQMKNDFISTVSHELRTPLTSIGGWAETIIHDTSDKQTAEEGLSIIIKETHRLSRMVEELLDFSRLESSSFKLNTQPFDIAGQLYDAIYTYNEMLKQQGIHVVYDEPDDQLIVNGDRDRIKQVFLNIIDNAAKYGGSGGRIDASVEKNGNKCVIRIKDYGIGIPEKELPFVKEKFFKGSAKGRGTGIGLSVCNEIISLHGGELNVDSVYGEGTTVTIILPVEG